MDNLVSRQAVEDWLQKWNGYLDDDMIARMQYRVIDIPSAEPQRKKGQWKGEGLGDYRCSLCGEVTRHTRTNFCPNCGAEMAGGEADE